MIDERDCGCHPREDYFVAQPLGIVQHILVTPEAGEPTTR
jgi:hypothetical protein